MKNTLTLITLLSLITVVAQSQTNKFPSTGAAGIGTLTPDASSLFDVTSTTKGVLIPRMTKTQRDAIVAPVQGLLIYQTNSTPGLYYFDGGWSAVAPKNANKSLSNLTTPTAVNLDLLPGSTATINLGSSSFRWNSGFINTLHFNDGTSQSTAFAPFTSGTGISIVSNAITNTAPDQVVSLTGANGISASGTYPNFSISASGLWGTSGNAGTSATTNFVGTTDAVDLVFRVNSTEGMRLNTSRRLGLGTSFPTAKMHINAAALEDALRVQTGGITRLLVDDAGGISIGSLTAGPTGGLFVNGSLGVGISVPKVKLHVTGGTNAGLSSGGFVILGDTNSTNIVMDNDAILARNNGASNTLLLNPSGGLVQMGGALDVNGVSINLGSAEQFSDGGNNVIASNSNLSPTADDNRGIGSSSFRWLDVWAVDGTINTSDSRDKTNIRNLDYGLKEILLLQPVKFNWKNSVNQEDKLGLIAQDLQKVLPEVVRDYDYKVTDEKTGKMEKVPSERLGVMYADIIPVLVKGMQELDQENARLLDGQGKLKIENGEQQKQIDELKVSVAQLQSSIVKGQSPMIDGFAKLETLNTKPETILGQNIPNPFDNSTLIPFRIPKNCHDASIMITNISTSEVISVIPISCNEDHVRIDAGVLASGTYSYSLYVDGKLIQTKEMAIVR